ncbi:haloalkane dehalogenase [Granulicella aggregans]|uniref:Haloalkane dehalogenase n=1 Tax=Granulicella aggregans TaxID=474949 RepID=A0A7W8E5G1_9BACT|nr:haloalkane dehalogenase [Granulicella aggregans]MBB5060033.1 haloalkane dehalogenase [Granulicella aggregans]
MQMQDGNEKEALSAEFSFEKQRIKVLDGEMAYIDTGGSGSTTAVFLHGNPTSSYLWRNVIPHVAPQARCLAPDLIGMGDSSKLKGSDYRFFDHARYLEAFLDAVVTTGKILLVLHDWGSALGLDWACRHEERVAGLALMEFIAPVPTWNDFPQEGREIFQAFRHPLKGRELLIEHNVFIEQILQAGVSRTLSSVEMDHYRAPFLKVEDREPLYRFPNELPIAHEPADVYARAERYHDWLMANELPKLYFWASPGGLIPEEKAAWYVRTLRNTESVALGAGKHFVQEDNPHLIGQEIAKWVQARWKA